MGFMDGFTSDGTVDMKHTEYYNLMKEAAKAELLSNAVKAEVPGFYIQAMITGEKPEFLSELKAEEEDTGLNRIDELRTIKENQEEHREQMKAAFREIEETMNTMAKMPPITINVDFGSKKGHVAAGEPEEGKPQDRDCWSCRTCGNTKPISMDVEKCRECEDGSQYTEADTPDEKSHEMESEEPDNGNE